MSLLRTRWAAVGAAVAVTLGAGGISLVDAAKGSGDRPVTVTIEPCRIRDTRPTKGIGGRTAPLGPTEAYTVQGTGPSGDCNIPNDATGLVLNVTADQATEATNLRLYPTGAAIPTTSNLNPRPGAAPTPNGVTVGLNNDGEFDVRNAKGNVHVIIDVTAYLIDHLHDDRYYTEDEIDAVLPFAVGADNGAIATPVDLTDIFTSMLSLQVTAPSDGQVTVNSSASVYHPTAGGDVACIILRSTDAAPFPLPNRLGVQWFESGGSNSNDGNIGGTRVFDVVSESTTTFELRCEESSDGGEFNGGTMTALFTPEP